MIINTSFDVRGEPIVCTPEDAYRGFMRTEMDILVLEDFILYKETQPEWPEKTDFGDDECACLDILADLWLSSGVSLLKTKHSGSSRLYLF